MIKHYGTREKTLAESAACRFLKEPDETPFTVFLQTLREYNTDSLILFDEALTVSAQVQNYLPKQKKGSFFQTRGGSLGVGIPGGMGVWLADQTARILVFTGDGGSMYTIQAIYTAVRYNIPVKIVICKNNKYGLLEDNIKHYWKEKEMQNHEFPDCFELFSKDVDIDYAALANSMGMEAGKVQTVEEAAAAARKLMTSETGYLTEILV